MRKRPRTGFVKPAIEEGEPKTPDNLAARRSTSGISAKLELGWSALKPERRARERDEQGIVRWPKQDWPRIKKSAKDRV